MNEKKHKQLVKDMLVAIGDKPDREGLKDTPQRVVDSWSELYSGYKLDASKVLKATFIEGVCDEVVILKDISFYSTCEHHMLPFFGKIHIGYLPGEKIVGVSKLSRLVEVYSRRLQIQERLTTQIAQALEDNLKPRGVMVVIEGQHFCMTSRGVKQEKAKMITSAIRGAFQKEETRQEFFSLIGLK
jgi:GTP cyclohydrolase I